MKYYDRFKLFIFFIFFILLNSKSVNAAETIEKNIITEVGSLELNRLIYLVIGAFLGSAISLIFTFAKEKIQRNKLKKQLLKHLRIELNVAISVVDDSSELNSASMPTALAKYLLTTNILDPINDRDIIESLSEYLLIANDYNKSHSCMGTEVNEKAKEQITNILKLV